MPQDEAWDSDLHPCVGERLQGEGVGTAIHSLTHSFILSHTGGAGRHAGRWGPSREQGECILSWREDRQSKI